MKQLSIVEALSKLNKIDDIHGSGVNEDLTSHKVRGYNSYKLEAGDVFKFLTTEPWVVAEFYAKGNIVYEYEIDTSNTLTLLNSYSHVNDKKLYKKYSKEQLMQYADSEDIVDYFLSVPEKKWNKMLKRVSTDDYYNDDFFGAYYTEFERICQVVCFLEYKNKYDGICFTNEENFDNDENQFMIWNTSKLTYIGAFKYDYKHPDERNYIK